MLSASAAFQAAPDPTTAADVVGAMLTRWHYIALAAPLALFALELRRLRGAVLIILFTGVLLAAAQSFVDLRIRTIRAMTPVSISDLDRNHPTRKRFGALHGTSMLLLVLQAIAAASVVVAREKREEDTPMTDVDPEREETTLYRVVVNDEEQYSIWPADHEVPLGWRDAGFQGPKQQCLDYIRETWTDMRKVADADPSGGGP